MATLDQLFSNTKLTENGDLAFSSTGNHLLDLLFMTEYYSKHLNEVYIDNTEKDRLFSMFVRDPRYGLGKRDLGRQLMLLSGVDFGGFVKAGRYDDIFLKQGWEEFLASEINKGNELAKKWAPRYSSKNLMLARRFAKYLGLNKQQYGKYVKAKTVERCLSQKNTGIINFEHVPSLAMIKYHDRFMRGADTSKRFQAYLEAVKQGQKKLNVATTSVYDIYRNRQKIDADLFFDKIEKIAINCVPIVDSSGSMWDANDSYGKAMAIGHYLAKCSTYAPNKVVSFSSRPQLITLGQPVRSNYYWPHGNEEYKSNYEREIASMHTGDCSNTDFGAVMRLFEGLTDVPEYLVVLSDMEFDYGSKMSKDQLKNLWAQKGYKTKIVWWNLNARHTTTPEIDAEGNIFMSGYNPMLLKFLEAGFDGQKFLDKLLDEYEKKISE
jgi:hypothetical protein